MSKAAKGILVLLAVALCSCTSPDPGARAPVDSAAHPDSAPVQIQRILLADESGTLNASHHPKPLLPDTDIVATVVLIGPVPQSHPLSVRLIDLKHGNVVGEQTVSLSKGQQSVRFEFKPIQPWTPGRHLLEARLGRVGKVFQREFDVVPGAVAPSAPN